MARKRRRDTRARILQTAGKAFLDKGYVGTLTDDIAACSEVSKGTLYIYFHSKKEMFETFMEEEIRSRAAFSFEPPKETSNVEEFLLNFGRKYLQKLVNPRVTGILRVVVAEAVRFPNIGLIYRDQCERPLIGALAEYFERCVDDGRLQISDTQRAAEQFMVLCQADIMHDLLLGVRGTPVNEEIEAVVSSAVAIFLAAYSGKGMDGRSQIGQRQPQVKTEGEAGA